MNRGPLPLYRHCRKVVILKPEISDTSFSVIIFCITYAPFLFPFTHKKARERQLPPYSGCRYLSRAYLAIIYRNRRCNYINLYAHKPDYTGVLQALKNRYATIRFTIADTCAACHSPPLAVGTRWTFNCFAIPRKDRPSD